MLENDSSHVVRPLTPQISAAVAKRNLKPEDLIIATDTDLEISGEYTESWLIVTPEVILTYLIDPEEQDAILLKEIRLADVETARTDTRVGSGFVEVRVGGLFQEVIRYSNKNSDKFAKVAQRLRLLAESGKVDKQEAEEDPKDRCIKCGVRLPDRHMRICPKCLKRGLVFMRFMQYMRPYYNWTAVAMVLVVMSIMVSLVPAALTRVLIDNVLMKAEPDGWFAWVVNTLNIKDNADYWLYVVVGSLAVTTLVGAVLGWLRESLSVWITNRLGVELRREVFGKLQDLAIRYHDTHPVGQLMTRCTQDIEALQSFFTQATSGFGYQIILLVSVAVAMLTIEWRLTLCAVLPAPVVVGCTTLFYHYIVPRWRKYWTARSGLNNTLHGTLNGVRVVKAFAQESREAGRFDKISQRFRDAGMDVGLAHAWFYPAMGWVFQLGSYFVWVFGGLAVIHPDGLFEMSPGTLIMFLGYLGMFYGPLNSLTQMSNWFTQFTTQAHRVFEVLDEEPEIIDKRDSVDIELQGAIHFKNVTFGYDPHIPVLHDINFHVEPGEMIGIVGHSGCGKSTTVNLIMRFYEVTDGEIQMDNVSIKRIQKICLRRQIGLVAQDPFLFRGSIAENISYGNPGVAPQQILNAALAANAHMFITRNHDGYDTQLGEHGSGLSGGERQRVAIARALLNNPRILILDEATSSVDAIAEREIQHALEALSLGRTTIAIAHRLSTLRNCDRVLVFEEGTIREQGTHEELLEKNGIYKKLVEIQTQLTSDVQSVEGLRAIEEINREEKARKGIANKKEERRRMGKPQVRYLDPKKLRIFSKDTGGMRVEYGDEVYESVRAYRAFPVSRPSEFVALWTGESTLEHKEVGMIRRLKELQPSSRMAVEHELTKRYFIHYIQKITEIREDPGFLVWNVETDKGIMEFMTRRFDRNSVIEVTENCHMIIDVDNNRYEIENIESLDLPSRAKFEKFIYW
jgi:ATP-binding cassette, subfamily B, bacterial